MPVSSMNSFGFNFGQADTTKLGKTLERKLGPSVGGSLPSARVGGVVPYVQAKQRIFDPNCIWYGNLQALTETTSATTVTEEVVNGVKQNVSTTVQTTTVVGFLVDVMLGLGLGPGLHLHAIYADEELIWSGDIGPLRTQIVMPATDNMMNGCTVTFAGGNFDQAPDPIITTPDTPGYVGTAYIIIQEMRADAKQVSLSFEVSRYPNPLALSAGVLKNGDDINLASAAVELMTNGWGAGGLDIAEIETAAFITAANTLDGEENFCAITLDAAGSIKTPLDAIQEQGQLLIFPSPTTGKITCKLIRQANIDPATAPRFYYKNIQDLRDFDKSGWHQTVEQLRGTFFDRATNYKETSVFWQNPANMTLSGRGKRTGEIEYPFVMNGDLAVDLISRDGAIYSAPGFAFTMVTNRDAATLVPGDIVSVTWGNFQVLNLYAVVKKVRKLPREDNLCVVTCEQIVFPNTAAIFGAPGAGYDPAIDLDPHTPPVARFTTAPYWLARARGAITADVVTPVVFPLVTPQAFNNVQMSFHAYISNLPGLTGDILVIEDGAYPAFGDLGTAIGVYDGIATGEIANILIDNVTNPIVLRDIDEAGVRAGHLLLFVDNEILSFESVTDMGGGTWQLNDVHRALLDTAPQAHSIGADCYIVNNNYRNVAANPFTYPLGYTPSWKIVSNTPQRNGYLSEALAGSGWVPTSVRTLQPYRPHDTKINGGARSSTPVALVIAASVTVSWKTRSRMSTVVPLQLDAAEPSERNAGGEYQFHRVYVRDSANALHLCGATLNTGSDNDLTFNLPAMATGAGFLFVRAVHVLNGVEYESLFEDRLPITVS